MSVGFGSDIDEDEDIQLNLSQLQLSEIRLAFTELSRDAYSQDGTWVPATTAALKKIIDRIFERTGWDIKDLFTSDELADMIDAVVKEPPHMHIDEFVALIDTNFSAVDFNV